MQTASFSFGLVKKKKNKNSNCKNNLHESPGKKIKEK